MNEQDNKFHYSYTAPTEEEHREIESIRRSYLPKERSLSKLERLRALDRRVKLLPKFLALSLGVVGCLVFGLGMAMTLEWDLLMYGGIVSVVGCILMAIAYPVHRTLLRRNRKQYGAEILKLSEEIIGQSEEKTE